MERDSKCVSDSISKTQPTSTPQQVEPVPSLPPLIRGKEDRDYNIYGTEDTWTVTPTHKFNDPAVKALWDEHVQADRGNVHFLSPQQLQEMVPSEVLQRYQAERVEQERLKQQLDEMALTDDQRRARKILQRMQKRKVGKQ